MANICVYWRLFTGTKEPKDLPKNRSQLSNMAMMVSLSKNWKLGVVAQACNLSHLAGLSRRITVHGQKYKILPENNESKQGLTVWLK
jgi:hypothetical protein